MVSTHSAENLCYQKYKKVEITGRRHRVITSPSAQLQSWKCACSLAFAMTLCLLHFLMLNKFTLTREV